MSFLAPPELKMPDGASHHFACTLPPSENKPEDFSQTTRSKQPAEPQRHDRGPQGASYRKRWAIISSHFLVAVKTKAWKLAAHADEAWLSESSVDQCRSEADVQRQAIAKCRLYFSTKCVKMRICNKFDVSFHHFNEFRLQSWSSLHSEFIQDTSFHVHNSSIWTVYKFAYLDRKSNTSS